MLLLLWLTDPFFWVQLLVLSLGVILFVRGLRGRKEGDEPRCGKCSYNLTGIASQRCPECGTFLTARPLVHGHRIRHPAAVAVGALLLLVSLGRGAQLGYGMGRQINWYNYRPFAWALKEAEAGMRDASDELQRRLRWRKLSTAELTLLQSAALRMVRDTPAPKNLPEWFAILKRLGGNEGLSADQVSALTEAALSRVLLNDPDPAVGDWLGILRSSLAAGRLSVNQVRDLSEAALTRINAGDQPVAGNDWMWLEILDQLGAAGHLSESQVRALYRGCVPKPRLAVRPQIRAGDCLPFELGLEVRVSWLRSTRCRLATYQVRIDDRVVFEDPSSDSNPDRNPVPDLQCLSNLDLALGAHRVECEARYACSLVAATVSDDMMYGCTVETFSAATVEVLPRGASGGLTVLGDPAMEGVFEQNLLARKARRGHTESTLRLVCEWAPGLPADAAFDVVVRAGDHEHAGETIFCRRNGPSRRLIEFPRSLLRHSVDGSVFVTLRSNLDEARKTVDLVQVWNGELTLGPVQMGDVR